MPQQHSSATYVLIPVKDNDHNAAIIAGQAEAVARFGSDEGLVLVNSVFKDDALGMTWLREWSTPDAPAEVDPAEPVESRTATPEEIAAAVAASQS